MNDSARGSGPVTHARIESLRLRIPASDARSAKALAVEVASKLALRVQDLGGAASQGTIQTRITAPRSMAKGTLADSIVNGIANRSASGGRK